MQRATALFLGTFLLLSTLLVGAAQAVETVPSGTVTTDFTFQSGKTYLITDPTVMTGTVTIEGGSVIKYADSASLEISNPAFATTSHQQAVFTSQNDDSVGETISASTGTPSNYVTALILNRGVVRFVEIRYAVEGILYSGPDPLTVKDSQFPGVLAAIRANTGSGAASLTLTNVLITNATKGLVLADDGAQTAQVVARNLTLAQMSDVGFDSALTTAGSSLSVTDSLFVDVQGASVFSGTAPATEDFNAFFQTPDTGAGANNINLASNPLQTDWFLDQASAVIDAGSQSAGNAGLYHHTTDANGALEATSTVDIGYHHPPKLTDFSILATNSIWLNDSAEVPEGKVGVNDQTAGPFLNPDAQLVLEKEIVVPTGSDLFADSIKVVSNTTVHSDVYFNTLNNLGAINGDQVTPLSLPILEALPLFRTATLTGGENNITVLDGQTITLAPGSYGTIEVGKTGAVNFIGGLYQIKSFHAKDNAKLLFEAASEVRIKEKLDLDKSVLWSPAAGSELDASDIQVFVEGSGLAEPEHMETANVSIVIGHFHVPNGTIWMGDENEAFGILLGKDIRLGKKSDATLQAAPSENTVAAPIIMPPGGTFTETVDVDMFSITSGATVHYTTDGTDPTTASPVFTGTITLTEDTTIKAFAVRSGYNDSNISTATFTIVPAPQVEAVTFDPPEGTYQDEVEVTLATATPDATIHFTTDGTDPTTSSPEFIAPFTLTETTTVKAFAVKDGYNDSIITQAVYTIEESPTIPGAIPEATPLDNTVTYNVSSSTEFLYTGTDPVQIGVTAGTIEPVRAAVVRGRVFSRDGSPLQGVKVTILDHPEFGHTFTRADGFYDMAVNGGAQLIVNFELDNHLSAQRRVQVPWQDFAITEDVALVPLDPNVTVIDLSAMTEVTPHQGSVNTDSDGTRQATLMFIPGTTAEMVLPDGTTQPLNTISVRATEYTIGDTGPIAMPAFLPPTTMYTYMTEYTLDEALAANATRVNFSQPVIGYVENFLGIKQGQGVPSGFYDQSLGKWVPEDNGLVIKIVGVTNGLADVDLDGDEVADDALTELNMTDGERARLASLYSVGQILWRVPLAHFTNYYWTTALVRTLEGFDWNFALGFPADAITDLEISQAAIRRQLNKCEECNRSIVQVQAQIFGESVPITGTPFTMHYNSDRVPGFKQNQTLDIPIIGDTVPASLDRIDLTLEIAGRRFIFQFDQDPSTPEPDITPNLAHTFTWDGLDAYARPVSGAVRVHVKIRHVYPGTYTNPSRFASGSDELVVGVSSSTITGRLGVGVTQEYDTRINNYDIRPFGLGGWSLDANHLYDPVEPILHLGTGPRRGVQTLPLAVQFFAGNGTDAGQPDTTRHPEAMAINDKGEIYFVNGFDSSVQVVRLDKTVETILPGIFGVPRPQLAMAPDGSFYVAEAATLSGASHRIRRVFPDGTEITVAGGNGPGFSGDGGLAVDAQLNSPSGVALDAQGNLYIADTANHRVRKVSPDGIIETIAGTGVGGSIHDPNSHIGDGGRALDLILSDPTEIEVDAEGNIYVLAAGQRRLIKIDNGGFGHVVMGGPGTDHQTSGIPAKSAGFYILEAFDFGPDGSIFLSIVTNVLTPPAIRVIDSEGIIRTISDETPDCSVNAPLADQTPLRQLCINGQGLMFGPDGNMYLSLRGVHRIVKLESPLPEFTAGTLQIPSEDGSQIYIFDQSGRHLETRNALTDATVFQFSYDTDGRLSSITDGDGDVTTFTRNASGDLITITSADGQDTTVMLDANGYLAALTNPELETTGFTYTDDGLMLAKTDARQNSSTVTYDALGLLDKDQDPAGGFLDLSRSDTANGYIVSATTAEGRTSSFEVETLLDGSTKRSNTDPTGLTTVTTEGADQSVVTQTPDGTLTTVSASPDPRFGALAPLQGLTVTTPGGLVSSIDPDRTVTFDTGGVLATQTDTLSINGRVFTSVFDRAQLTFTDTSPEGRTTTSFIDAQGRIVQQQIPNIFDTGFQYDARGRLTTVTQGTSPDDRQSTITYNAAGFIGSITDPLGRAVQFEYDAVGRVVKQILPDLREINFTYDDNGNVTSITPPGRPQHGFAYNTVNLETDYNPPSIGLPQHATQFSYNLDRQLTSILRPDGQTISLGYDTGGRLSTVTIPFGAGTGDYTYSYDAATGNLTGITSPAGEGLGFGYDGSLLLGSTWTGTVSGSVSRTYDNDFRITSRSVNGANTISFGYDADSLLTSAGSETLTYDPANGLLTGTTLGVVDDAFGYNGFGEVSSYSADVSGTPVFATDFVRDKLGRIVQKTETVSGVQHVYDYAYDTAGRLVEVKKDSIVTATYSYDANGNRLNNGATYDDQDRLLSTSTASYTYTANGELLTKTEGADTTQYSYDVLGNLLSVTLPDGTLIEYVVDGRNRRVGKKVNGVLTRAWLYKDGLNPIAELDGAGNVVSRFVYASRANVPDYVIQGGVAYRIVSDHLGSPRQVINTSDGTTVQQMEYDAWGNVLVDTNPGFQPFGFAGGLYDPDTKLVRFGARDYDPEVGRWTKKDPIGFGGGNSNLFGYVVNDPINFIDPSGLIVYRGFDISGSEKFEEKVVSGIKALEASPVGREFLRQAKKIKCPLFIQEFSGTRSGEVDPITLKISLNLEFSRTVNSTDGGFFNLTVDELILHELGHVLGYTHSLEDELKIIHNIDNKYSIEQGRPLRDTYSRFPDDYEKRLMRRIRILDLE